jgi:hypothetical protein
MIMVRCKPDPIIGDMILLIAQDEHNLLLYVDREAAKHGSGPGRNGCNRIQNELMRDELTLLDGEWFAARQWKGVA